MISFDQCRAMFVRSIWSILTIRKVNSQRYAPGSAKRAVTPAQTRCTVVAFQAGARPFGLTLALRPESLPAVHHERAAARAFLTATRGGLVSISSSLHVPTARPANWPCLCRRAGYERDGTYAWRGDDACRPLRPPCCAVGSDQAEGDSFQQGTRLPWSWAATLHSEHAVLMIGSF